MDFLSASEITAFVQVVFIDLVLAGDNAIVVGMAAAGLPVEQRRKAIILGITAAAVMRILFALVTVQLLAIVGLMLAGGLLLLWVCWKLWLEIKHFNPDVDAESNATGSSDKSMMQAMTQIVVADITMSLDNVLAVAGAARDHTWVLVAGLALSVAFMGLAASLIAGMISRHRWIAYLGLVVIFYIALRMIYDGAHDVFYLVQE